MSKKISDRFLIILISFLFQAAGWWAFFYDETGTAITAFLVALLLGLYGRYLREEEK